MKETACFTQSPPSITHFFRFLVGTTFVMGAWLAWAVISADTASAREYPVHEFNICGNCGGRLHTSPVDVVHYLAAVERPIFIALAEVCETQHWLITARLSSIGYQGSTKFVPVLSRKHYKNLESTCGDCFGYAMWALGAPVRDGAHMFSNNPNGRRCNYETHTCRQVSCRDFNNSSAGRFVGCVLHLISGTSESRIAARKTQIDESIYFVNATWSNRVIVAGDFNETPASNAYPMDPWYPTMADVHSANLADRFFCELPWYCPTHNSGRKIDYIFGRTNLYVLPSGRTSYDSAWSDHHHVRGTVAW